MTEANMIYNIIDDDLDYNKLNELYINFDKVPELSIRKQITSRILKTRIYRLFIDMESHVKLNLLSNKLLKKNYINNDYITPLDLYNFWEHYIMKHRDLFFGRQFYVLTSQITTQMIKCIDEWENS
jgi:hypothetical protein